MGRSILQELVKQRLDNPGTLGRLACWLRRDDEVEQRHHDNRELKVFWAERPGHWRCTIFLGEDTDLCIAQVNLHDDGDVIVEVFEPASVTISPQYGFLLLHRYRPA